MVNYGNGKIYKLVSNESMMYYIGSTTKEYLCQRMVQHKGDFAKWQRGTKNYITAYEILKYDDAKIVLVENFPCKSKDELLAREQYYLDQFKQQLVNDVNAKGLNMQRYKDYNKQYKASEAVKAKQRQKVVCSCGSSYRISNASYHIKSKKHQKHEQNLQ
jgi:predicted lipase